MFNFISLQGRFIRPLEYKIQLPHIVPCNQTALICGNVIELTKYERPLLCGQNAKHIGRSVSASQEDKKVNRNKVLTRARHNVRQLANANPDCNKFLTLTFAENLTDIDEANYLFKKFMGRLKYAFPSLKLKYIAVSEFQKRGAVHYHLLCNLPYIDVKKLNEIWGNGYIKLNKIDDVNNVGAYITKYMQKDFDDPRLIGKKCYMTSRNLNKPTKLNNDKTIDELLLFLAQNDLVQRSYSNTAYNDYFGNCVYTQIILKRPVDPIDWRRKDIRETLLSSRLQPLYDFTFPAVQLSLEPVFLPPARAGAHTLL